jgi:hypothetical protein
LTPFADGLPCLLPGDQPWGGEVDVPLADREAGMSCRHDVADPVGLGAVDQAEHVAAVDRMRIERDAVGRPEERPTWVSTGRVPRRSSAGLKTRLLICVHHLGIGTGTTSFASDRPSPGG